MYTILNGDVGNVLLNIKILQKSVMSRDSIYRHRDLSDQSQFLSLHENLSPSPTRIESHPEPSGGSLHPLEDLLTAGSAFIHAFLDFTHWTPSGQPRPDLLILRLRSFRFGTCDISAVSSAPAGFLHFMDTCIGLWLSFYTQFLSIS